MAVTIETNLAFVLDDHHPRQRVRALQQRTQQSRLPGPGLALDENRHTGAHRGTKYGVDLSREHADATELFEGAELFTRDPQRKFWFVGHRERCGDSYPFTEDHVEDR